MADKNFVVKNGLETGSNTTLLGTAVTVTATGNVGINNSAPTHRLSTLGDVYLGNTTIVGFANTSTSVSVGTSFIGNTTGVYHTGTMNAASYTVGTSTIANSTGVYTGIVNGSSITIGTATVSNGTGVYTGIVNATSVNAASHTVGTAFTANATVVNAVSYYVGATLIGNATGPYGKTEATLNVNSAVNANNSDYLDGQHGTYYTNATNITTGVLPYAQIPANVINTTAAFTISGVHTYNANVVLGSGLSANGTYGTAGQILHSNGTATYWAVDDNSGGTVTSVGTGSGLTGGPISLSGTVSVLANNGITANTLGLFVTQGTGVVVNATGVHVNSTYIGTLTANNTTFVNDKSEGNLNVNNATTAYGKTEATLNVNNATTAYGKTEGTLNVNSALTANNSTNLGGTAAASYQLNSTLNANVAAYLPVYAGVVNGSSVTVGTSLIANATGVYHTGTMNAASHTVGTAFTANATVVNAVSYYVGTTLIGNSTGPYGKTEATLNVNNATTAYGKTEGNLNVNNATTATNITAYTINQNLGTTNSPTHAGMTLTGNLTVNADIYATRTGGNTGVIYLGNTAARYVYYNGATYQMPGAELDVNGQRVLNAGNYNSYSPTLTGTGASGTWGISITGSAASATGSAATFTSTTQNSQFNSIGVGTAASGTAGEIRANNNITAYYTSDAIFKENVKPIENALEKIMLVDGVEFDWTQEFMDARGGEDGYFIRRHDVGVIAQNIEKVLPEVVATKEDGTKAVKYDRIVSLLIEAIKDLKKELDELKKQ